MSMQNRTGDTGDMGETVASVRTYKLAQDVVSQLISKEVAARDITIVGIDVRTIERITGRLGYAVAARNGAFNGVLIGLFLSAIFVLGNPESNMQTFLGVVFVGVAVGMILALISYMVTRRRRDFASVTQLSAERYEVRVQKNSLQKARTILGTSSVVPRTPVAPAPVDLSVPPLYGERLPAGTEAPRYGENAEGTPQTSNQTAPSPSAPAPPPPQFGERVEPDNEMPAASGDGETSTD